MVRLKKDLERIRLLEKQGIDNTEREKKLIQAWNERGKENKRDKEIYQQFIEIAEKFKDVNDNRFRLDYVYKLNLDWNILILLGKKNIGKTYNIHRLIDECIATDREVFMVRVKAREIESALRPFFDDPRSKVRIKGRGSGTYDLVVKPTNDKERNKKARKVGSCCSISTLTAYQGASYPKVKYIIWDECITDGVAQKITNSEIRAFERFISSIVRDKKDVKVFIFGNLLSKVEAHKGDPLLGFYGIDASCGCKYIEAKDKTHASILFLNTKSMFKGIEDQGVLGGIDDSNEANLLINELSGSSIKTVGEAAYYNSIPLYTLVFTYDTIAQSIHIRRVEIPDFPTYLIVRIKLFNEKDIVGGTDNNARSFTNEESLFNTYSHCMIFIDKEQWDDCVTMFLQFLECGRVLYADDDSAFWTPIFAKHLKININTKSKFGERIN